MWQILNFLRSVFCSSWCVLGLFKISFLFILQNELKTDPECEAKWDIPVCICAFFCDVAHKLLALLNTNFSSWCQLLPNKANHVLLHYLPLHSPVVPTCSDIGIYRDNIHHQPPVIALDKHSGTVAALDMSSVGNVTGGILIGISDLGIMWVRLAQNWTNMWY